MTEKASETLPIGTESLGTTHDARTLSMRKWWREIAAYFAVIAVCFMVLIWTMRLERTDLRTPFTYQGDALFYHLVVKGVVDNGWFQSNPMLGMPYGLDLRDVPTSDNNLYFVLIKLISLFTSN